MGIDAKHAYRFGFLKSEQWQTLRLTCIAMDEGKCVVCGKYDPKNDAHHLFYRETWADTKPQDLLTLCRDCHSDVHKLGEDITAKELWKQYKCLCPVPVTGCEICHVSGSLRLFSLPDKPNAGPSLCDKCSDQVVKKTSEDQCHPWKHIRLMKEKFRVNQVRQFHAANLRTMLSVGVARQYNRDFFSKILPRAAQKIRKYLLTQADEMN